MWDIAESRKTGILVSLWNSRAEGVEIITENMFYCLGGASMYFWF